MNTKLPAGLEKLIEQKADTTRVYGALLSPHEQDIWIDGGTEIALEVLQRAEKLAEALKECLEVIDEQDALPIEFWELQVKLDSHLSDWQKFIGDKNENT